MHVTVSKWGNSLALRLPKPLADEIRVAEGATVNLEVADGALLVTPLRRRYKLSELLAGESHAAEIDWGPPRGEEI